MRMQKNILGHRQDAAARQRPFTAIYSLLRFSAGMCFVHAGILLSCNYNVNSVSGSRQEVRGGTGRTGRRGRRRRCWLRRRQRRRRRTMRRNRVSHLNASLEVIPLGHFLVLRRGNFSPSAQLLLGVVQVKDRHGVQPALEHQARQVFNVVPPAGEKYPRFQISQAHGTRSPALRLPRPGRSCNAPGRARTSSRAVSARRVAHTFRDRPRLARATVPAASNGSFELDTRRNESWEIHGGSR